MRVLVYVLSSTYVRTYVYVYDVCRVNITYARTYVHTYVHTCNVRMMAETFTLPLHRAMILTR